MDLFSLPENSDNDTPDQRRYRIKLSQDEFLNTWRTHSLNLSKERQVVINELLENSGRALKIIGYQFMLKNKWKPVTSKQLGIYNGNPYAIDNNNFKRPHELFDEVEELKSKVENLEQTIIIMRQQITRLCYVLQINKNDLKIY